MGFNFQFVIFFSFFLFFIVGVSDMSEPFWCRVEEAKKKKKKRKKKGDTAWTSEFSESYQFWCPTRDKHLIGTHGKNPE